MDKKNIPKSDIQLEIINDARQVYDYYDDQSTVHRERMVKVYKNYTDFYGKKQKGYSTPPFRVNKSHEVVEKILPRLIAKDPRWIVTPRIDNFVGNSQLPADQRMAEQEKISEWSSVVSDYLAFTFDEYNLREKMRLWAKAMLIYGYGIAKTTFKYDTFMGTNSDRTRSKKISGEYPTIEVVPWTNFYVDQRFPKIDDQPAIIEVVEGVRLSDLKRRDDLYFNLDKIDELTRIDHTGNDRLYRDELEDIAGISPRSDLKGKLKPESLRLDVYYGLYKLPKDDTEKWYKFTTVEKMVLIGVEELTHYPFEVIKAFEDPELFYPNCGFVEPIIGIENELNFKKLAAAEYINQSMYRSWVWSANSGINPAELIDRPGNIITTAHDAQTAMANLIELPHRSLPFEYFQEQNDMERQIQGLTFTVDTANPRGNQAMTNTATGIRVKFFESNSVIDEVRKHFEEGMARIAYKLLQETFDNLKSNITIKKQGTDEFWEVNKEVLRDAVNRYSIKVETNSSSFDDVESRREDAIAFFNIGIDAAQAGVPVNLEEAYKDVIRTFEKRDPNKFISEQPQGQQGGQPPGIPNGAKLPAPEFAPEGAQEITEDVIGGGGMF